MNLFQMSISGAVMILVVIVIRALAINRLPKKTFIALWGIVLLRLLVPFSFPSPFSAYSFVNRHVPAPQGTTVGMTTIFPNSPAAFPTICDVSQEQTAASVSPYVWIYGQMGLLKFFFLDEKGTIDICFVRNSDGSIVRLELIKKKAADTILNQLDVSCWSASSSPQSDTNDKENKDVFENLSRISKNELPSNVLSTLNSCTATDWYLIEDAQAKYVYYRGLPYNFAYQYNPGDTTANIIDFGKQSGNYVLLAMAESFV